MADVNHRNSHAPRFMALFWRNTDYDGDTVIGAVFSVSSNDFQELAPNNRWGICNIPAQGQCSSGLIQPDELQSWCENGPQSLPTFPIYIWKSFDEQREYDLTQTGDLSEKIVFENSHEIHKIELNDDLCTIKGTQYMTAGTINRIQDNIQDIFPDIGTYFMLFGFSIFAIWFGYQKFRSYL